MILLEGVRLRLGKASKGRAQGPGHEQRRDSLVALPGAADEIVNGLLCSALDTVIGTVALHRRQLVGGVIKMSSPLGHLQSGTASTAARRGP